MSFVGLLLAAAAITVAIRRMGGEAAREAGVVPVAALVMGGLLSVTGRAVIGVPMMLLGVGAWYARRARSRASTSSVRTEWLAMTLDHATGRMDGEVVRGTFAGRDLEGLSEEELTRLAAEIAREGDRESRELLEAYLDRRMPGWRDRADGDEGAGLGAAPGSGAMSEQEAHEILGLAPGAGEAEIREAHRRLMKRAHPDAGGTIGLAARLNEAKDILLRAHGR